MKNHYIFLLIFISCKQNDDFKGGRVFEIRNNSYMLNCKRDTLLYEESKKSIDSFNTSLDSFKTNKSIIKIGPKTAK